MMIRIYECAEQLDAAAWEAMAGNVDVALSHAGIRLAEQTAGVEMRYIVATAEDGSWVGGLPVALATSDSRWVLGRPDALLERARRDNEPVPPSVLDHFGESPSALLPSLLVGGRHMGNSGMLLAETAPVGTAAALLAAAEDIALQLGAHSTSAVFVSEGDKPFADALKTAGYAPFGTNRYSSMTLPSGGFDGWLATFPKKKRWKIRDERRRISSAGFRSETILMADADLGRLADLETQLLRKYGHEWAPEHSVSTFERIVSVFGDDASVSVVEHGGEVAGFVILLRLGSRWSARQVGFDYEAQGDLPLYFETLFYGPVESAQLHGVDRIDYGLGSEEAKVSRGCIATTQRTWVKAQPS